MDGLVSECSGCRQSIQPEYPKSLPKNLAPYSIALDDLPIVAKELGLTWSYDKEANWAKIQSSLENNKVVIVDLDAGFLDPERGIASYMFGHAVVITKMDENAIWFHDPDLSIGGGPHRALPRQDFWTAWDARYRRILTLGNRD